MTTETDELSELTKDELAEEARDREIRGRSSMNKDELVEAIRAHDAGETDDDGSDSAPSDEAPEPEPAQAEGPTHRQVLVTADPERWGGGSWSGRLDRPLRFSNSGRAWATIAEDGERLELALTGPDGPYTESVVDYLRRQSEFTVVDEYREITK